MPGHLDGIYAGISLILQSPDPMTYTNDDWRAVERALESLKGRKLGPHTIAEVTVSSMHPTAAAISRYARTGARKGR
jgi:hypothetical protein